MEKLKRTSGILLHITSLPNRYGWGNFSNSAFQFVDFLKNGGFGVWQVLPFSECLYGDSPFKVGKAKNRNKGSLSSRVELHNKSEGVRKFV